MSFVNLEALKAKYTTGYMKDNVENLIDFDVFHCLLSGSREAAVAAQNSLGAVPAAFMEWVELCDGGMLFDTVLATTNAYDAELDLEFDTYDELNTDEMKDYFSLPEGFAVFGVRSYGDPLCFNVKDNDGKVYLWNVEKEDFDDIWDTFTDWMTEEIDDAVGLIAEDVLDPFILKLED